MTRPLGYSAVRATDGLVRLEWAGVCPGCLGAARLGLGAQGPCSTCHGAGVCRSSVGLSEAEARTLRDALTAALIVPLDETFAHVERETFTHADREWARQDAWERRPENISRPKCDLLREWDALRLDVLDMRRR